MGWIKKQPAQQVVESAQQLETSQGMISALVEGMWEGVLAVSPSGDVQLANAAASRLTGLTHAELFGRQVSETVTLINARDGLAVPDAVSRVIKENKPWSNIEPILLIGRFNKRTPVRVSAAPIRTARNGLQGVVLVIHDISPEWAAERAKAEFIELAAHQLRTPVGSLRWGIQELLSGKVDGLSLGQQQRVQALANNVERLTSLVDDLLKVVKVQHHVLQAKPVTVDVEVIIGQLADSFRALADQHQVRLDVRLPMNGQGQVQAEPELLKAVLRQLVTNAIVFNRPDGKVTLEVRGRDTEVEIEIADTGIGIPLVDQPRIFEKFYRASNAAARDVNGAGLGLFLARSYVEGMGGGISFTSQEGQGTTFTLTLPRTSVQPAPASPIHDPRKTAIRPAGSKKSQPKTSRL